MTPKRPLAIACIAAVLLSLSPARAQAEPGPLTAAILDGDIAAVRAALDAGAPPNAVDPDLKHLPLYVAVSPGGPRDTEIAALLVARGARIDTEDAQTGLTPLMTTMVIAERGPFASVERAQASALVERLIKLGANPNRASQSGDTPLMLAVALDNLQAVRALLSGGADPNQRNARQETALHAAHALRRPPEMIAALLAAGADPALRDARGMPPQQLQARSSGTDPLTSAPATPGESKPGSPEPAAPPPEAGRSTLTNWLIGGAIVAATVVGAVLIANRARDQKKKRENAQNTAPPQLAAAPIAPVPIAPAPIAPAPIAPAPIAPAPIAPAPIAPAPIAPAPIAPAPSPPGIAPPPIVLPTPPVPVPPKPVVPVAAAPVVEIVRIGFIPEKPVVGKTYSLNMVLRNTTKVAQKLAGRLHEGDPRKPNVIQTVVFELKPEEQREMSYLQMPPTSLGRPYMEFLLYTTVESQFGSHFGNHIATRALDFEAVPVPTIAAPVELQIIRVTTNPPSPAPNQGYTVRALVRNASPYTLDLPRWGIDVLIANQPPQRFVAPRPLNVLTVRQALLPGQEVELDSANSEVPLIPRSAAYQGFRISTYPGDNGNQGNVRFANAKTVSVDLAALPAPAPIVTPPLPPPVTDLVQLEVVQGELRPPFPAAGQTYSIRLILRNTSAYQLDKASWSVGIISRANPNTMTGAFPTQNISALPRQQFEVFSPPLVHDGTAKVLQVATHPGASSAGGTVRFANIQLGRWDFDLDEKRVAVVPPKPPVVAPPKPPAVVPPVPQRPDPERITMRLNFITGITTAQVFTRKVQAKITRLSDLKEAPLVGGTVSCSGVGTETMTVTINASGYYGSMMSDISCWVEY